MWDKNVGDFFYDALGNAFLWNQLGHLSRQHSAQQCVRNLIRARDTVLVASESSPSGDILTLSTLLKNVEVSLIIIFFTVSP